ncbi:MAG: apolipoprotein N-acyltransferase [Propionibacteriaceae bacterium]|jgi:apolipoprotein N-acyltransferase|nr:apolipoprotein N-acyltransferase [Propionibacteriaceae bacterium]
MRNETIRLGLGIASVRARWPLLGAVSLAAGLAVGCGFAPLSCWPLSVLGLAVFTLLCVGLPPRRAAAAGYAFGLGLFGLSVSWIYVYGLWMAVLLVAFMALWGMLYAVVVAFSAKLAPWPLLAALGWVGIEYAMSLIPFGGFPWTRLAYTTAAAPFGGFLRFVGVPGTSLLVALTATLLAYTLVSWVGAPDSPAAPVAGQLERKAVRNAALAITGAAAIILSGGLLRLVPIPAALPESAGGRDVNVGVVQGNVDGSAGPRSMGYAGSVLANHYSETVTALALARTGLTAAPDFVLWPENASDLDPTNNETAAALIGESAYLAEVPVLVGAVMAGPGENERQTSALWWEPGVGITARYDKRNAVPFGEYTPWKDLVFAVFPQAKQVGRQTVPGVGPGVLPVEVAGAPLNVGVIICYELGFDATVYDVVRAGAEVITVQSNNAGYAGSWQPLQQFEITRVRAMELGREIVVATTSSYSGLIGADGSVLDQTQPNTAAARVYSVPLREGVSLGVRIAPFIGPLAAVITVLGLAYSLSRRGLRTVSK